jgi:hypothetical protein
VALQPPEAGTGICKMRHQFLPADKMRSIAVLRWASSMQIGARVGGMQKWQSTVLSRLSEVTENRRIDEM